MIKLYNSLTRSKETLKPIKKGEVGVYTCGPTVYDHIHVGNLRSFIMADTLVRVLREVEKLKVKWVVNITDVDDKMIKRAGREYPDEKPLHGLAKLADKYTDIFVDDIEAVGIDRGDITKLPRATDSIAAMQAMIRELLKSKIAYVSRGSIYFSLEQYQKSGQQYGVLTNVHFDAQARVIDDQDQKEGVGDFALWKAAKNGEPSWDFELDGENLSGRPGWHIECSAMSSKYLGTPFDIHTGGIDLKFPHHENEIAQSGGNLANIFIHNEHLTINEAKMSKSLGNIKKISDIKDPRTFRLMCLAAHYRSHMDFSSEGLAAAHIRLQVLRDLASKNQYAALAGLTRKDNDKLQKFKGGFISALEDDLNTPQALSAVAELESEPLLGNLSEVLEWADRVLGLELVRPIKPFSKAELEMQHERNKARQLKDFGRSDELRDKLLKDGIESEDLRDTTLYWRSS